MAYRGDDDDDDDDDNDDDDAERRHGAWLITARCQELVASLVGRTEAHPAESARTPAYQAGKKGGENRDFVTTFTRTMPNHDFAGALNRAYSPGRRNASGS